MGDTTPILKMLRRYEAEYRERGNQHCHMLRTAADEIERLREALREIAYDGMSGCINYESGRFDCYCKKCTARRALAEIGGEDG